VTSLAKNYSINELKIHNVSYTEPSHIAVELNKHFVEVRSRLASVFPQNNCSYQQYLSKTNTTFRFERISVNTVLEALKSLPTKKAVGLDNISARLLKVAAPVNVIA